MVHDSNLMLQSLIIWFYSLVSPSTKIIPGHGLEIKDRQKLIEFRDMILDIQDRVYSIIREGLHLDEIIAASPTAN